MKSLLLVILALAAVSTAHADLYCRWDPTAAPSSFIRVFTKRGTAMSITGWPQKTTMYRDVVVQKRRGGGFTIVVFGDVPLVQAASGSGTLWYDQNEVTYPFAAYWNPKVPGGPTRQSTSGVCWTDHVQKTRRSSEGPF
jgi:hypothetical protein